MGELQYSILRYAPSLVSGEKINLGAIFNYPEENYREFFYINKWKRVETFDDSLCIPLLKDLMLDIKDEVGTSLTSPEFDIQKFCTRYHSEIYFDDCIFLDDIDSQNLSDQIEEIKKLYFQFEFSIDKRPSRNDQKKFLSQLFKAKKITYKQNARENGKFNETISYDYLLDGYGIVFFFFFNKKIDNKIMNRVKAWAWNCKALRDTIKIIILYDLAEPERQEIHPALEILKDAAYQTVNIHDGFGDVNALLEKKTVG